MEYVSAFGLVLFLALAAKMAVRGFPPARDKDTPNTRSRVLKVAVIVIFIVATVAGVLL